jgi:thymidylate synthase (FAD)
MIGRKIELHGHGHVILEAAMGGDLEIANSARVSLDKYADKMDERSERLVRRLLRDKHGTPFEDVALKFDIKAPIAVVREFHRHRVPWSYSEKSLRYVEADAEFYVPDADHVRRQVGDSSLSYTYERIDDEALVLDTRAMMESVYRSCMESYREMIERGVAKELARMVLPVGLFTQMKARTNLRGLMHFLSLRNHPAAMREIREIAEAMEELVTPVVPIAMSAFVDNSRMAP